MATGFNGKLFADGILIGRITEITVAPCTCCESGEVMDSVCNWPDTVTISIPFEWAIDAPVFTDQGDIIPATESDIRDRIRNRLDFHWRNWLAERFSR